MKFAGSYPIPVLCLITRCMFRDFVRYSAVRTSDYVSYGAAYVGPIGPFHGPHVCLVGRIEFTFLATLLI